MLDEASTKGFVLRIHKVFLQVTMKTKPQWKKMVKNSIGASQKKIN
jgi:hypothetical protein